MLTAWNRQVSILRSTLLGGGQLEIWIGIKFNEK